MVSQPVTSHSFISQLGRALAYPSTLAYNITRYDMRYTPFDSNLYTGRAEPFEPLAQYWYQHIGAFACQKIALLGFACDQGVNRNLGRIGAKHAPDAIKTAFGKLPISLDLVQNSDLSTLVGDLGNVICDDDDRIVKDSLEQTQQLYSEQVAEVVAKETLVIGLGGGHEIAWGSFLGLYQGLQNQPLSNQKLQNQELQSQRLQKQELQNQLLKNKELQQQNHQKPAMSMPKIGIINFDAHFDLRQDEYATSGTPFRQIAEFLSQKNEPFHYLPVGISKFSNSAALFCRANTLGVNAISDDDCCRLPFSAIGQQLTAFMAGVDVLYLTVDMDCLSGSVMPAVSAPAAKGLSLEFVERCVEMIVATGKVKMLDIAEINPTYDVDGRGVKVAGRLLAKIVQAHLSLQS